MWDALYLAVAPHFHGLYSSLQLCCEDPWCTSTQEDGCDKDVFGIWDTLQDANLISSTVLFILCVCVCVCVCVYVCVCVCACACLLVLRNKKDPRSVFLLGFSKGDYKLSHFEYDFSSECVLLCVIIYYYWYYYCCLLTWKMWVCVMVSVWPAGGSYVCGKNFMLRFSWTL